MKKDLVSLIIKECCEGRKCDVCPFSHFSDLGFKCYLIDIINIIKNYKKENK